MFKNYNAISIKITINIFYTFHIEITTTCIFFNSIPCLKSKIMNEIHFNNIKYIKHQKLLQNFGKISAYLKFLHTKMLTA